MKSNTHMCESSSFVLRNTSTYLEHIEFEPSFPFLTSRSFRWYIFLAAHKGLCTFQDLKCEILYARAIDVWCGQCVCEQSWDCSRTRCPLEARCRARGSAWTATEPDSGLHSHRPPQHFNGSLIISSLVTYDQYVLYVFYYVLIYLLFFSYLKLLEVCFCNVTSDRSPTHLPFTLTIWWLQWKMSLHMKSDWEKHCDHHSLVSTNTPFLKHNTMFKWECEAIGQWVWMIDRWRSPSPVLQPVAF